MQARRAESGQVLPIVALLMVVIIGVAAFAIDGSNMYSQHRRMQAAVDVAVKVAAAKMFNYTPSSAAYTSTAQAAIQSAAQILTNDGYTTSLITATYPGPNMSAQPGGGLCGRDGKAGIIICTPPTSGPFQGKYDVVDGIVSRDVRGYFGGVLGLDRAHESVRATALHGGATEPFAIISLDPYPDDCGIEISDSGTTLTTLGSLHSNSQTCNKANGTAIITGTVESVVPTSAGNASPITGTFGVQNGGAAIIANPYSPTVPMASTAPPITICSSGCTATGFGDLALKAVAPWAWGTGSNSCFQYLQNTDPQLVVTPPGGVTYYLPPDAPNAPSLPWGSTAVITGMQVTSGEYDFLPHCDSSDPSQQTAATYYFTGSPDDLKTSSGPALNSFNSAFVFDPNAPGYLIDMSGNSGDQLHLQAALNGPLQGLAIYENQPCTPSSSSPQTMQLTGSASSQITGIVDVPCAEVDVTGNSTNDSPPFINGILVGWRVVVQGASVTTVNYNQLGTPPDKGSVLTQ